MADEDGKARRLSFRNRRINPSVGAESPDVPAVLEPGTLAAFIRPLRWVQIYALDDWCTKVWWREAIVDADIRGLLQWNREAMTWGLTDAGRKAIRDVN
jgi:hypothetical protein